MREAKLEPTVIFSYSAGISACEKGDQWQRALALLSEMREAKLEPNTISSYHLQCWGQRVRERLTVAEGSGIAQRDAGGEDGAHRHQLQRWGQRLRKERAVAVGFGAAERDAGDDDGAQHLSYTDVIRACQKGEQWQKVLSLLREL
ncbi:unnamed protein product [Prorocentrum cordatum]|uniref:Pentatricopeptide repeat-containing protein n=1 Tax=Prorocentrum cordatum TaxID=2364126 RepID=A0ABN9Y9M6_9DINO|nr:unnamed protein product [Polarella glacialis]